MASSLFSSDCSIDVIGRVSPLMLADRLLSLAEDAERSGLHRPAERLLRLAYAVYGEKPARG